MMIHEVAGTITLNKEFVDIGSLVRDVLRSAGRAHDDGIAVEEHMPKDTIHVHADRELLKELVEVLFDRTRKAEGASGTLRVEGSVKESGRKILISFNRTGNFSPALPSIEHFRTERIGVALQAHGAALSPHSHGYVLELPLAIVPILQARDMQEASPKRKILVVDDNVDGAVTLSVILKHMGHSVRITHDGSSALAVAPEFKPDVVLMDIGMPGMDGYETCERMRAQDWSSGVRIVALTGWGQEEDRRKAKRAGFDQHLVKPVDRQTLMDVLKTPAGQG